MLDEIKDFLIEHRWGGFFGGFAVFILVLFGQIKNLQLGIYILTLGILIGYLLYETVHYCIHSKKLSFLIPKMLRMNHLWHHSHQEICFGVTSLLWDKIFQTGV